MTILMKKLLFVALLVAYTRGDVDPLHDFIDASDDDSGVTYRDYQAGDKMNGGPVAACDKPLRRCFVAVDTSVGPKTVIGVIETEIPDSTLDKDTGKLIRDKTPPSVKKDGEIGYIHGVAVVDAWRRRGIATNLIDLRFKNIDDKRPEVSALYLDVMLTNKEAIALYEKTGFVRITKDPNWLTMARYLAHSR
ncbi:hypothetical protein FOL47_004895 [Perkinsus chesapeaki]|uniref:N-alpha-acetyltransferase 60 n=1 Tax=Perkinsus chesapeaki TaxID=330153 RepID=A0A7J6M1B2_PERCH|nr:hypothetical protein FOL47_004895 [Perkinsus chesapeaki]